MTKKLFPQSKSLHVMGIGGSAMSAIAILAQAQGFMVDGCDLSADTPYISKVKKSGIKTFIGHDENHVISSDFVAVTPATFYQSEQHPEVLTAKNKNILLTGRQFEAKYLHANKRLICIAGTHGKSTTTAMAALAFEDAKKDPWVMLGATVREWGSNCRVGGSDIFIVESDEFYDNFLSYKPETIVLNNIEFDHPDFFKSEEQMYESFAKHIKSLTGAKNLIVNQDSIGVKRLLSILPHKFLESINLVGYSVTNNPQIELLNCIKAINITQNRDKTTFEVKNEMLGINQKFELSVAGLYNVSNALGVIALGALYNLDKEALQRTLKSFDGIGRRMEKLIEKNNIVIYDDYAHHPTAIRETLKGLRQKYPKNRVWAIIEPHTFSRTKALLPEYKSAFQDADKVIIAPIFKSRDTKDFGISGQTIVDIATNVDISYLDSFDQITKLLKDNLTSGDVVIVMGAGLSYQLARDIANNL